MRGRQQRTAEVAFWLFLACVMALGAWLRFESLDLKPLHHDESVNGWISLRLYWWGVYQYWPTNFHGPFLYYVNLIAFRLLGPSDVALRVGTAMAGTLLPLALLPLRPWLGRFGCLTGAVLLATSPGMVYYSRSAIHEGYLVLFTVLWAGALARYAVQPGIRWGVLAALAAALCFANKETALLTAVCLAAGAVSAWVFGRSGVTLGVAGEGPDLLGGRSRLAALRAWTAEHWPAWGWGVVVFGAVTVTLFSSFFTYLYGVPFFLLAFLSWFGYGVTGRNQGKPADYFVEVLEHTQGDALLWLALAISIVALVMRHRLGVALAVWLGASLAVYSAIPYKTPWCVLNIELPLILVLGWGSGQALRVVRDAGNASPLRLLAGSVAICPLAVSPLLASRAFEVNGERYDDPSIPYVYYQTRREVYDLVADLLGMSRTDPLGGGSGFRIVVDGAQDPVNWYLVTRGWDYQFLNTPPDGVTSADVRQADAVLVTDERLRMAAEAVCEAGGMWHRKQYPLYEGVSVTAWFREDLWVRYQSAGGRAAHPWPLSAVKPLPAPDTGVAGRAPREAAPPGSEAGGTCAG